MKRNPMPHPPARVPSTAPWSPRGWTALVMPLALGALLLAGCGRAKQETPPAPAATPEATPQATDTSAVRPATQEVVEKGSCIDCVPHVVKINPGESVTWKGTSLKSAVTITLPPGVFPQTTYVIGPGESVNSGPAERTGIYYYTTSPLPACQTKEEVTGPGVDIGGHVGGDEKK